MPERGNSLLRDLIETVVLALVVSMLIKAFVFETTLVDGPSMQPGLHTGERLVLNKVVYRLRLPRRGEIVVFRYPKNPKKDFIKRVIGLPGERVAIVDGTVYINGEPWVETHPMVPQKTNFAEVIVPPGTIFVLGDNRPNSEDSRMFGPVPLKNIKGKAFIRFWPLNAIGLIK